MAAQQAPLLDDLAEELTRRLGIPFKAAADGTIGFRDRFRVTDWAVPLLFDGHVARRDDALVPVNFVGQLLWPALHSSRPNAQERAWWQCTLTADTAAALVQALQDDEYFLDRDDDWVIGRDVLLEEIVPLQTVPRRRRRVA